VIGPRQKVAIVIPSLAGGGAERVMLQVAGGLDSSRFDVTLIALNGKGDLSGALPSSLHSWIWEQQGCATPSAC